MAILSEVKDIKSSGLKESELIKLLDNQATDETLSDEVEVLNAEAITLIVEAGASVSGGVVLLEGAHTSGYTGTWLSLGSVTTNAASKLFEASISLANGDPLVRYVRARIETAISGGTVDVYLAVRR